MKGKAAFDKRLKKKKTGISFRVIDIEERDQTGITFRAIDIEERTRN